MSTLVLGFGSILVVLGFATGNRLGSYFESSSLALVIGGTLAVFLASTPFQVLISLLRSLFALLRRSRSFANYQNALASLSQNRLAPVSGSHPLIVYASELWTQGVGADLFVILLTQRKNDLELQRIDGIQALKNLVKYPPALGMAGTVMGMVSLFSTLDRNKDGIGQNLSVAMTSTFLGLLVANFLVAPLADRLHVYQVSQERLTQGLFEILLLINQGEPAALVKDELNERAA